ncbi:hypothetical protein HBO37_16450 [Pseudomonas proteolytica]|uniref:hypothetical protein n=1 Tax=Pseudomonas proteolytica TaxID=219574 RepID=UPI001475CA95|nr:hypothetical protein [Pseudomonas proteolytica]NMZ06948.1 hypothetical protein [Pseudomonas proteolytica]
MKAWAKLFLASVMILDLIHSLVLLEPLAVRVDAVAVEGAAEVEGAAVVAAAVEGMQSNLNYPQMNSDLKSH